VTVTKQVERLVIRQEGRADWARRHGVESASRRLVNWARRRRREPAGANEIGKLGADLVALTSLHRPFDGTIALGRKCPGDRHRGRLGKPGHAADGGIQENVDVSRFQPQVRQRFEGMAVGNRVGKEDGVDAAGTGTGEDNHEHAQLDAMVITGEP
jgi:hypothetical protein